MRLYLRGFAVFLFIPSIVALLFSCRGLLSEQPDRPEEGRTEVHSRCADCHDSSKPSPGDAGLARGAEPSAVCSNCHSLANHHPVNMDPGGAGMTTELPLYDGEIRCLTCHQIHGATLSYGKSYLLREGRMRRGGSSAKPAIMESSTRV